MKTPTVLRGLILLTVSSLSLTWVVGSLHPHEKLRLQNTFKSPEEVINYYCSRDASGFVWSGLLERERQEFTLWGSAPESESFYVAEKYEIVPNSKPVGDTAKIEVRYLLRGMSDAFGTVTPVPKKEYNVVFALKRVNGQWKIAQPQPPEIAPVVLESKFPLVAAQR